MSKSAESALRKANEELRASEERYRLIADNVADVIWTTRLTLSDSEIAALTTNTEAVADAIVDRWRFSFISPSGPRLFGYTPDEAAGLSLRDIAPAASYLRIREAIVEELSVPETPHQGFTHEWEFRKKDGASIWCEVVSTYLHDERGVPCGILGITRDVSVRREAQRALRKSESQLRDLFENLPDVVAVVDRDGRCHFVNRSTPSLEKEQLLGQCGFDWIVQEYREPCRRALEQAIDTGLSQAVEIQDVFGHWWSLRIVSTAPQDDGRRDRATIICTDVTQERLANEAVEKERRLLRQMLELHERDRQLTAYEIHDGFAQQLTGALYRLQGFRDLHARNPAEAWTNFDSAVRLISRAIDETRRLISGLRPPILDESGIVAAIEYLAYEYGDSDSPTIEFVHDVAFQRLAAPLETAIFRIAQESLQNACRHSRSDRVRVELAERDGRVHVEVRDWGIGFCADSVEEQRFGLQGIRERVRLLEGRVVIESVPGEGTRIAVELPLVNAP